MRTFRLFCLLALFCASVASLALAQPYKLTVRAERPDAVYKKGETVAFQVRLTDADQPLAGKELQFTVQGDGRYEKKGAVTSSETSAVIEASLDRPGFLKCTVEWTDAPQGKISGIGGAGVDPENIRTIIPDPADFDAFWNKKKEELARMPMNARLEHVPADKVKTPNVEVFDIKVDCLGGKPLSGYFARPIGAKPKSLPIVITYHGAGVRSANMPVGNAARGSLALDINAHGLENGQPESFYKDLADGPLKDYRVQNAGEMEKLAFYGMYLRVIRSLQFMKAQPEWDGKTIAVYGGSQGGGQALVAAGIDSDVSFCVTYVPALCYHTGDLEGNFGGWPGFLRNQTRETADPAVVKTVPYFDAAIFAKRVQAESVFSVGFIDYVCSPTSVYIAYNNVKAPKQMIQMPDVAHATPRETSAKATQLMWEFLESRRVK